MKVPWEKRGEGRGLEKAPLCNSVGRRGKKGEGRRQEKGPSEVADNFSNFQNVVFITSTVFSFENY